MRIAYFSDFSWAQVTGIGDALHTLMQQLNARGHSTCFFAPSEPGHRDNAEPLAHVSLSSIGLPWAPIYRFTSPFGIPKGLKDFRPDIIHTNTYGTVGFQAVHAARSLSVPLVGTEHTMPAEYARYILNVSWMKTAMRKFAAHYYQKCDLITAPSQMVIRELVEDGVTKPMHVVSNPLELSLFRPLPDRDRLKAEYGITKPAILCFGRLAKEKNIEELLDAFALLKQNGTDAQLVMVGSGPAEAELRNKAHMLGIDRDIRFLGMLRGETLVEAINATDVYAIVSRSETQSMTMMQAMSCGLPVIAVNHGALPEYIVHGENGFLAEGGNVKAIATHLAELLTDPAKRAAFGASGRAVAAQLAPEHIAEVLEQLYESVLKK